MSVCSTPFMWKGKNPDPEPDPVPDLDPHLWLMAPDPGGPKTCRSASGSPRHWYRPYINVRILWGSHTSPVAKFFLSLTGGYSQLRHKAKVDSGIGLPNAHGTCAGVDIRWGYVIVNSGIGSHKSYNTTFLFEYSLLIWNRFRIRILQYRKTEQ